MNILVVCENFAGGGLETHIHSYYMELRDEHNFIFAIGKYKSELEFEKNHVIEGFHFGWESTIEEFGEDVDRLVWVINNHKIDVIHVHPFFSFFPAVIASQLTSIPIVCTYHGIASFSFSNRINDTILFHYMYTELVSRIFTVSEVGKLSLIEKMHVRDAIYIPNAVDSKLYKQHKVISNRKWAAISRLDADNGKESALKNLFRILPELHIDSIDVYGDGTQRKNLEEYVKNNGLADRVCFKGFQYDLYSRLDEQYNGIIGTDRVAIEGLTMGYPVMELGYGRICGIFDEKLFENAKKCNFDANLLPECQDVEKLNAQLDSIGANLEQFNFRQKMICDYDIKTVAKMYIEALSDLPFYSRANIVEWYYALKALPNQNENLYRSQIVFATMRTYIEYYAVNPDIKLLFLFGGECHDLRNAIAWVQDHGIGRNTKENQTNLLFRAKRKMKKLLKIK